MSKRKKGRSIASTAIKALRVANQVKNLLNVEVKHHDDNDVFDVDDLGDLSPLMAVSQGSSGTTRDGDSLKLTGVSIRGKVAYNAALGGTQRVRVILMRLPASTVLTTNQIILGTGTTYAVDAPQVWQNKQYAKFLYDRTFNLYNESEVKSFHIKKKLGFHIKYAAGTVSPVTNDVRLLVISDTPNAGANFPICQYWSRFTFVDN